MTRTKNEGGEIETMIALENDRLVFRFPEVHEEAGCSIEFQRTLRIPDDGTDYPLPPGLGNFLLRRCYLILESVLLAKVVLNYDGLFGVGRKCKRDFYLIGSTARVGRR